MQIDKKVLDLFWVKQRGFVILVITILVISITLGLSFGHFAFREIKNLIGKQRIVESSFSRLAENYRNRNKKNDLLINIDSKISSFLPNVSELFNTLSIIENISKRTGFKIESYTLNSQTEVEGVEQKQNILIKGAGSQDQFMNFLKEYKFITGQAVTIDTLNLSSKDKVVSSLSLNFFSYKPKVNLQDLPDVIEVDEELKQYLKQIDKYAFDFEAIDKKVNLNYSKKKNPFLR